MPDSPRHPATAAVWDWLENGAGKDKQEVIRRAAQLRVEALDREFLAWDAEISARAEHPAEEENDGQLN